MRWKFLVGAPLAVFSLYIVVMVLGALQLPLSGALVPSSNGGAIMALVGIMVVMFAVGVVWNIYKNFRGDNEYYYQQGGLE
jgi:hypothetical protein